MLTEDQPCTKRCLSSKHGDSISSALTKRGVSDGELCAYLNHICQFCGSSKDLGGRTSLHMAASCGRTNICKWLICQKRASIDDRDSESGYTALHRSVFYGKIDTAVALVKLGANLNLLDGNSLSPLEHAAEDNVLELRLAPKIDADTKMPPTHFIYVWGSNSNYTLGPQQSRGNPEILDVFHRERPYANVVQVCLEKFHTLILTESGEVYSFGLGQGGRLGLGYEKSIIEPTEIKFGHMAVKAVIKSVSAARDHSIFLTDTGNVYICGLNNHCVLGIQPPPPQLLTPRQVHTSNFKQKVVGVTCGRYHSVAWTKNILYTWGLHAGQLGHAKSPENYINTPKPVPFTSTTKESVITAVAASCGATAVSTSLGDIYVLHEFQCRRIASRELNIKSISIMGGNLIVDSNKVEVIKSELKVVVLTNSGNILIWQESDPQLNRCIFSLNRLLHIREVSLNASGLFFVTIAREIFHGKLKPRKKVAVQEKRKDVQDKNAMAFHKFINRNDCVMVQLNKVHKIYGADAVSCDSEGENFAALHVNIARCVQNSPLISSSVMLRDFKTFVLNTDVVEDVNFKVENRTFPAHKFIVANSSDKLHKMIFESGTDVVKVESVHPDIFEQILKYMYTNESDLLREGECPATLLKFWSKKPKPEPNEVKQEDVNKSAFEIYSKQREDVQENKANDPIRLLQEAAKKVGVHALYKDLNCFVFSNGRIKMKGDRVFRNRSLHYEYKKFADYYDVSIKSKNGNVIEAHRCVLVARSEFFNNMFSVRWIEKASKSEISLPFPQNTINHLLSYLYTDQVNLEGEDVDGLSNLLVLADHILLPRLIELCELHLATLISVKTVIKLLSLGYYYNANQLKSCAMEYLSLNLAAMLEGRYLEQLDNEILRDLTKFYADWNEKISYRVITPFSEAVPDECIQKISTEHPIDMDFEEEIVKSTAPKSAQRKRNRSHKISFSEKLEIKRVEPLFPTSTEDESGTTQMPISVPARLQAINAAKQKMNDSVDDDEFVKLNDFPDLNRSFSESEFCSKSPNKHEKFDKMPKMSQKQRKRLSSENGIKEVIPEAPKNPWKVIEPVSPVGSPNAKSNIDSIITEERKLKENLVKIKNKLLVHTQMEDKALEELQKFYNIENVFDEIIVAERVQIGLVAAPVWVQR